jgi:hypothetical protein
MFGGGVLGDAAGERHPRTLNPAPFGDGLGDALKELDGVAKIRKFGAPKLR